VEDTIVAFDGQNRYQQDTAANSVELATSISYRDAADNGNGFVSTPSAAIINRRAREYGRKLVAGGSKCHSHDDNRAYRSV
jgi:hypothetical protein